MLRVMEGPALDKGVAVRYGTLEAGNGMTLDIHVPRTTRSTFSTVSFPWQVEPS